MIDDETTALSVQDRRYARLVRLAYLVLPAMGKRRYRLALAQRIVDASLPPRRTWGDQTGSHSYAPIRSQVLRQAMRPSRRLRVGLGRWLRGLPKGAPATPARLAGLDPAVRAAYVLRRAESLPRSIVRDQLAAIGVPDATDVVAAADEVPELALPRVVPGPPVPRRSHVPVTVAGVLTVAAMVAAQSAPLTHHTPPRQRPQAVVTAREAAETKPRVATVQFWAGRLPTGVRGRWLCRRTVVPGRPTRADGILIVGTWRLATGDCGHVAGATVGGTWWHAPDRRWYFVAAASPRFAIRVIAPATSAYHVPGAREGMVAVPGPRGAGRPGTRMAVTAHRVRAAG